MNSDLVLLAILMFAATYPARVVGLLLVGPAILASVASVTVLVVLDPVGGAPVLHIGIEWLAVLAAVAVTAKFRNLPAGLIIAVAIVAIARAVDIGGLPG